MTIKYEHLCGLNFEHGKQDCYEIVRMFFRENFQIELSPYARPDDWWDKGMDLYNQHYWQEGFRPIDIHPRDLRAGDCFLMVIRSQVANHTAVYLGNGKILHHYYGRKSEAVPYSGIWKNTTVAMLRHKDVKLPDGGVTKLHLIDQYPPGFLENMRVRNAAGAQS